MTAEVSAGRELDAEVAVRVMGWQRRHADPNTEQFVVAPPGWTDWSTFYWLGRNIYHLVPLYGTDLAAAGQVVPVVMALGPFRWFDLTFNAETDWFAKFSRTIVDADPVYGSGDSPALAICRAALAALVRRD